MLRWTNHIFLSRITDGMLEFKLTRMGHDVVKTGRSIQTFQRNILLPSSVFLSCLTVSWLILRLSGWRDSTPLWNDCLVLPDYTASHVLSTAALYENAVFSDCHVPRKGLYLFTGWLLLQHRNVGMRNLRLLPLGGTDCS